MPVAKKDRRGKASPNNLVVGRRAVETVLSHTPDRIDKILLADEVDSRGQDLLAKVEAAGVVSKIVSRHELDELVPSTPHQSVVCYLKDRPLEWRRVVQAVGALESGLIVALDGVQDPQNLGALIRVSECFGASAVFWPKDRSAQMSHAVRKAGVGATELIPCCSVPNLVHVIEPLKEQGYWVVGAMLGEGSQPLHEFEFPQKTILLLGAEGAGIRQKLIEKVEYPVQIQMSGQIESLNVSQAASVLLHTWQQQWRSD